MACGCGRTRAPASSAPAIRSYRLVRLVLEQILVDLPRRAVHEPHLFGAELEAQIERQPAHEVLRALVGVRERPRDRLLPELAVVLGHVGAPAVVELAGDRVVVVAIDRRDPALLDHAAHLVRMRPVPDEIAAAVHGVDPDRIDRLEARLECGEVGVDVGDDGYAIQFGPDEGRCSWTSSTAGTSVSISSHTS